MLSHSYPTQKKQIIFYSNRVQVYGSELYEFYEACSSTMLALRIVQGIVDRYVYEGCASDELYLQ